MFLALKNNSKTITGIGYFYFCVKVIFCVDFFFMWKYIFHHYKAKQNRNSLALKQSLDCKMAPKVIKIILRNRFFHIILIFSLFSRLVIHHYDSNRVFPATFHPLKNCPPIKLFFSEGVTNSITTESILFKLHFKISKHTFQRQTPKLLKKNLSNLHNHTSCSKDVHLINWILVETTLLVIIKISKGKPNNLQQHTFFLFIYLIKL